MPNGIDLEDMFRSGSKWSLIAWILAVIGLVASIFVVGFLSTYGLNGTLWGLWIIIFWLNITTFILAQGSSNQLSAIAMALRGVRDESDFSDRIRSNLTPGSSSSKTNTGQSSMEKTKRTSRLHYEVGRIRSYLSARLVLRLASSLP